MRTKGHKCYNIKCGACVGKTLCGLSGDEALTCVDRMVNQKTNADRIRAMSDEELANELLPMFEELCEDGVPSPEYMQFWLKLPYEEDA